MRIFLIMAFTLLMSGCANAQSSSTPVKLDVIGETLPAIRHINDMKMSGDTLFLYTTMAMMSGLSVFRNYEQLCIERLGETSGSHRFGVFGNDSNIHVD